MLYPAELRVHYGAATRRGFEIVQGVFGPISGKLDNVAPRTICLDLDDFKPNYLLFRGSPAQAGALESKYSFSGHHSGLRQRAERFNLYPSASSGGHRDGIRTKAGFFFAPAISSLRVQLGCRINGRC